MSRCHWGGSDGYEGKDKADTLLPAVQLDNRCYRKEPDDIVEESSDERPPCDKRSMQEAKAMITINAITSIVAYMFWGSLIFFALCMLYWHFTEKKP